MVANHTTARVIMKEPVDLRSMADGSSALGGGETMASRSEVCVYWHRFVRQDKTPPLADCQNSVTPQRV